LCVLGDLVNRGPGSLQTLERLQGLGDAACCVLGNHDLHLLAVSQGVRRPHRRDTVASVLESPRREAWLDWLRVQPLALRFSGWLCVHAGVAPSWTGDEALARAAEVSERLAGPQWRGYLQTMYGNQPDRWDPSLEGTDRLRFIVNALTRIRFVDRATGALDLATKGDIGAAPPGCDPWFDVPGRASAGEPIAFGHWSTLGLVRRHDLLALDTGCVWGGALTAVRVDGGRQEVHQVRCAGALAPGEDA
jgi:bis(5'-nucleosyl)-tetraphosphatase (symmetrical)